jgi:hypothetical protein
MEERSSAMGFYEILEQVVDLLRRGRVTYRALQREFQLDEDALNDLKDELLYAHPEARDDAGRGLVWSSTPDTASTVASLAASTQGRTPLAYTPAHLTEQILAARSTLEALKRVLLRESQVQPLVLVFEDLHWIDAETQALLNSLVESLPTARILLLVNYRPEYQHAWGSKTYYSQLRLDPLAPASAEELLQALLGDDTSLAPLTPLLIARTEGNPFFLEESVRTLVETQVLVGERSAYRLAQAVPSLQVPTTV